MGVTVQAHAKLLVLGEHAAVYGAPALGVGLPWPLTLQAEPADRWSAPGVGEHESLLLKLVQAFQERRQRRWGSTLPPQTLSITTEVPLGSGFGSSGALCAALARLFFDGADLEVLDEEAWKGEHLFHGTPSGIDTALALRQGWWSLTFPGPGQPPQAHELAPPAGVLVCGAVVRRSDTRTLVGNLASRRKAGDPVVTSALSTLAELARQACDGRPLAPLICQAREALRTLDLESAELTTVLDRALNSTGALAAKLSGAGGGGAWVALYSDETTARAAVDELTSAVPATVTTLAPRVVISQNQC